MAKSRHHKPDEHLKSIIQKQKRIIQDLQKQLARMNKRAADVDLAEERIQFYLEEASTLDVYMRPVCPDCKAKLNVSSLGNRKLSFCKECGYRKTTRA